MEFLSVMVSVASIASSPMSFLSKNDASLSSFSSFLASSSQICASKISRRTRVSKIVSLMTSQHTEHKPSAIGSVKTALMMTKKILARASEKSHIVSGKNVWINVDVLTPDDSRCVWP